MIRHIPAIRHTLAATVLGCSCLGFAFTVMSCSQSDESTAGKSTEQHRGETMLVGVDDPSGQLSAGLVGSMHDFTRQGDKSLDLCTPCHTPHLPLPRGARPDGGPDRGRLVTYQSDGVALDSASLVCLSCHDGVIASDVYTASHATQFASQFGTSRLGGGLLAGHPIGVKYPSSAETYRPAGAVTADGRVKLPDGRVQCISCHDPHNTGRHPGMLVQSNAGSRLCLACHRL